MDRRVYQSPISKWEEEVKEFYGSQLVTLALFGSYARGEMRLDPDRDVLILHG